MNRSEIECSVPKDVLDKLGDRYSDIKYVSRGATSMVFSAHDSILDKRIAIKVLTPSRQEDFIRFQQEAKAASQLDHAKLVKILNFDVTDNNHAFLIMGYVEGDDLDHIVEGKGDLSLDSTLDISLQICEAMEHAHQKQIAHRDLKASNIIVSNFGDPSMRVTVVDFGLARVEVQEQSGRSTPSGSILGSPRYMSPEQAEGKSGDTRSDIYSLGCIIFKMLTGDTPFDDTEVIGILRKHVSEKPPRLSDRTTVVVSEQLESVVRKMLEKDPDKRYQRMRDVYAELEEIRFPETTLETPAIQPRHKLARPMILWWSAVLTVPLIFGLVFLIPYMAQKFEDDVPVVSPLEKASAPSPGGSLKKFKELKIEFEEPGKYKLLVTRKDSDDVVTDGDLQYISTAMSPKCEGIDLKSFAGVKGEGIQYLRNLPIECVDTTGMNLTPEGWKYLSEIKSLKEVVFDKSNVTDADLKNFETHPNIYIVALSNCTGITDNGVRSVAKLKDLSKLDLTATRVTDEGLKPVSKCPKLYRIYLEGTRVGDQGIRNLKPTPELFDLHIVECPRITGNSLKFISATWPDLKFLEIGGTSSLKTEDLENLRPLKKLTHLNIVGITVTDPILKMLGTTKPELCELYIGKGQLNDESLKYCYPMTNLKTLTLLGCGALSDDAIKSLQKQLNKPKHRFDVICPDAKRNVLPDQFNELYGTEAPTVGGESPTD